MRFLIRTAFSNKVIRWLAQAVGEMRDHEVLQAGGFSLLPPLKSLQGSDNSVVLKGLSLHIP